MKRFIAPILALLPVSAWAASAGSSFTIDNPLGSGNDDFGAIIQTITDGLRTLAIPVAVVMIVWAGFNFLTAAGNPSKVQKGKQILTWTVVGLAIIFIGSGFISLIKSILAGGQ